MIEPGVENWHILLSVAHCTHQGKNSQLKGCGWAFWMYWFSKIKANVAVGKQENIFLEISYIKMFKAFYDPKSIVHWWRISTLDTPYLSHNTCSSPEHSSDVCVSNARAHGYYQTKLLRKRVCAGGQRKQWPLSMSVLLFLSCELSSYLFFFSVQLAWNDWLCSVYHLREPSCYGKKSQVRLLG